MIDGDTKLTVTLTAVQWNTVMQQLSEGRWNVMDPLMKTIQLQCQQQTEELQNVQQLVPSTGSKREYPKDIQVS